MNYCFAVLIFLIIIFLVGGKEAASPQDQIDAVKGLVSRVLGDSYVNQFNYQIINPVDDKDVFSISSNGQGSISLQGSSGVALASGLNWYLNYYCNCSLSWGVSGSGDNLRLPNPLPKITNMVTVVSPVKYRYYMNVCTVSYSAVWWDWSRWEREIDWMALSGINLPLSFTGQEYIETQVWTNLGLTQADLDAQFSGPAFLAWERMGNMRGWGGPLDDNWKLKQFNLQKQILTRQRSFGMITVLPAFSGHVPQGLARLYPNAQITRSPNWGNFPDSYCCDYLLQPTDPLFQKIGQTWITIQTNLLGTDHIYNADTFNEMKPSSNDSTYLHNTASAVLSAMRAADPQAIWLMQGWLFQDTSFWTQTAIQDYLGGVSNDDMIILDLYSDESPVFSRTNSYYGKPFIWCMLHNFGGARGIYGLIDHIATAPLTAENNTNYHIIGTGITMEAIEQNPIIYTLMNEMGWRSVEFDTTMWVEQYVTRRYGTYLSPSVYKAWDILHHNAYSQPWNWDMRSLAERRPGFQMPQFTTPNATALVMAWRYLAKSQNELVPNGPWFYDLVDISRQALTYHFYDLYGLFSAAYKRNNLQSATLLGTKLIELIYDVDTLLQSNVNFLLGNWLESAKSFASNESQKKLYEFNARNQITLWGPTGQIEDYAAKSWAGLYSSFYLERWNFFIDSVIYAMSNNIPFNQDNYVKALLIKEQEWCQSTNVFPTTAMGDSVAIVNSLLFRYANSSSIDTNFTVVMNTDAPGNDIYQSWTKDIEQIKILCALDSDCLGFNSNGWMKSNVNTRITSAGTQLFIKN